MTRSKTAKAAAAPAKATSKPQAEVFTFGDAESVLDRRDMLNYVECWQNGRWYEPPINPRALGRVFNVTSHHRSALALKINLLVESFVETPLLSAEDFEQVALDYLVTGNGYLERIDSMLGRPMALKRSPAINTRVGVAAGAFFYVGNKWEIHEFAAGSVFHMKSHDVCQEIYGLPEYLAALQSALLNESATLFRRRYYLNGSHAGYVFYLSEASMQDEDVDAIREQVKKAKGVGNFKNLFLHVPNGKKDGVQIIPISEVAAKDEFLGIKNTTRDDVLAAHRVPPQLLGIVPANAGGFGDVSKAAEVFRQLEIKPLQRRFLALNRWLGFEAIAFAPDPAPAQQAAASSG